VTSVPDEYVPAFADYDGRFVAAFERGAVLACQFHPELSGEWGVGLLRRWLETGGRR
jgi:imidazoleglycerol phosphate synthase glutamine amidotransferase subunit HisH